MWRRYRLSKGERWGREREGEVEENDEENVPV